MPVSQFSSRRETKMPHLKQQSRSVRASIVVIFLKHRLAKEVFLFRIDFMVSLYNYEQTRLSLKSLYVVPAFKERNSRMPSCPRKN
jgi:hypothetical protein